MDSSRPPTHGDVVSPVEFDPPVTETALSSSSQWSLDDLLDCTVDDSFLLSFDDDDGIAPLQGDSYNGTPPPMPDQVQTPPDRIRKRDPRLKCSNFIEGRVPCACPEIDAKLEEEEVAMSGKKRVRVTNPSRCQVPGCEADITQLKGYHRRHKVCLDCANASAVLLDGESKRYCQQCGKFHVLLDFDSGKRSCRRKLERHNSRRRRKPQDLTKVDGGLVSQDTICDDGCHVSAHHNSDDPNPQNVHSNSGVPVRASGDAEMVCRKDDSKASTSNYDNKIAYSSTCPTGRISFKLYDWNPAEFPRRLRHQIYQWLASMPVELEGYIRPGCTILTAFIAMPSFMWDKLLEDPVSYLHDLLACGENLSKNGPLLVYLNNVVFHVSKDGSSVSKVNLKGQTPRLHYVHPACFEAGRAMDLVACGSNLSQPKYRFLVSFGGKYLTNDYCMELPRFLADGDSTRDHQLYKISIPPIEANLCGPAFIEVENESGLSNFIPVIIGDKRICSEMEMIQHKFNASNSLKGSLCEVSSLRQMAFSELLVDIAWLLQEPLLENFQKIMTSSQIQRFNSLLNFLLQYEPTAILDKILRNLKIIMDTPEVCNVVNGTIDDDLRLLQKHMNCVGDVLRRKLKSQGSVLHPEYLHERDDTCGSYYTSVKPLVTPSSQDLMDKADGKIGMSTCSTALGGSERSLVKSKEDAINTNLIKEQPRHSTGLVVYTRVMKPLSAVFVIALLAVCFGVCAFLLHPKVRELPVTLRRCLRDGFFLVLTS